MGIRKKDGKPTHMVMTHEKSPVIGNNVFKQIPAEDRNKITNISVKIMQMPMIDMDDYEQVRQRIEDYFNLYNEYELKPTMAGLAAALNGHGRRWVYAVAHDTSAGNDRYKPNLKPDVASLIRNAYYMLEEQWESYMLGNKINAVAGIFFGKNHYLYQDKQEHIITPNKPEEEYEAEDIKKRYLESGRTSEEM